MDYFLKGEVFKNQEEAGSAFKEFIANRSSEFNKIRINKMVLCWQKCIENCHLLCANLIILKEMQITAFIAKYL